MHYQHNFGQYGLFADLKRLLLSTNDVILTSLIYLLTGMNQDFSFKHQEEFLIGVIKH